MKACITFLFQMTASEKEIEGRTLCACMHQGEMTRHHSWGLFLNQKVGTVAFQNFGPIWRRRFTLLLTGNLLYKVFGVKRNTFLHILIMSKYFILNNIAADKTVSLDHTCLRHTIAHAAWTLINYMTRAYMKLQIVHQIIMTWQLVSKTGWIH